MKLLNLRYLIYSFLVISVMAAVALLAAIPATSRALPNAGGSSSGTPPAYALLPMIRYDASPTPAPTPVDPPFGAAAALYITPYEHILASTFNTGSFHLKNTSRGSQRLVELRIDLATAVFRNMVFDPFGAAGDTVAKDITVDAQSGMVFKSRKYESPHDGGFDVVVLRFDSFDRGDEFLFSVDIDPTSITGANVPGPNDTGSVGGLELVGATITATFNDGTVLTNQVSRMDDPGDGGATHSGAVAVMRPGLPDSPMVGIHGISSPAVVNTANQTVRVNGPVGRPYILMVIEGGLFIKGVPNGGFDLDPFESNTAITVREYRGKIGLDGTADVPVTLSKSMSEGGINIITAVFDNHYGVNGRVAVPLILQFD